MSTMQKDTNVNRNEINGFSLRILRWGIEIVTVKHLPKTIVVYRNNWKMLVRRWEW